MEHGGAEGRSEVPESGEQSPAASDRAERSASVDTRGDCGESQKPPGKDCRHDTGTQRKDCSTGEVEQSGDITPRGAWGGQSQRLKPEAGTTGPVRSMKARPAGRLLKRRSDSNHGTVPRMVLATDTQRIESIGAVGARLQLILLGLGELLTALILLAVIHSGSLDRNEQILIILTVDHRHKLSLSGKHTVDQKMLHHVIHSRPDIHLHDKPAAFTESRDDSIYKSDLALDSVSPLLGGVVKIKYDTVAPVMAVIPAEVIDQSLELALKLHEETLEHHQLPAPGLAADEPVDIGIEVKGNAERLVRVNIRIHQTRRLLQLIKVILAVIEVGEVSGRIFVRLGHGRIEAVPGDADTLAENGCLESKRREIPLELPDERLAEHNQIIDGRDLAVIDCNRPQARELTVETAQLSLEVRRGSGAFPAQLLHPHLDSADLIDHRANESDKLGIIFPAVVEKPRALLRHRHITRYQHRMMEKMLAEILTVAAQGRKSLILELGEINKLRLIYIEGIVRLGIRCAGAVLADDESHGSIAERKHILIILDRKDRRLPSPGLGGLDADGPMDIAHQPPSLPVNEHRRQCVGERPLGVGRDNPGDRAGHIFEIAEVPERVHHALAESAAGNKDGNPCLHHPHYIILHIIKVNLLCLHHPSVIAG